MPRRTTLRRLRLGLGVLFGALITLSLLPFASRPLAAQSNSSFGSAVPCLTGKTTFATTCFADTMVNPADAGDAALAYLDSDYSVRKGAMLGQRPANSPPASPIPNGVGSVYGVAYDDGVISGIPRIFMGAFTRRLTGFGSGDSGGIYAVAPTHTTATLVAQVPGAGSGVRQPNDLYDYSVLPHIGRSGLGDLEISPDGRTLYAMNLGARRIERYDISQPALQYQAPISIPWQLITADPAIQADLVPFALEFYPQPFVNSGGPVLVVGITDTARRGAGRNPQVWPRVHVLSYFTGSQEWIVALNQDLHAESMRNRHQDSDVQTIWFEPANADQTFTGWNPWRDDLLNLPKRITKDQAQIVFYPQPLLTDIEFSQDGTQLWLGLRDRTGDMIFSQAAPNYDVTGVAQGDVLGYTYANGAWHLVTVNRSDPSHTYEQTLRNTVAPSDYFNDNQHVFPPGPLAGHLENHLGGLSSYLQMNGASRSEQMLITTLLGEGSSGIGFFPRSGGTRTSAQRLVAPSDAAGGKSGALGDLERICTYAFIQGRVWQDLDGDGLQDPGEPGFAGITLELFTGDDARASALAQATTDANGNYIFALPPNTPIKLRLAQRNFSAGGNAAHWQISLPKQGGDQNRDSDLPQMTGYLAFAGTSAKPVPNSEPMLLREEERQYDIGLRNVPNTGLIGDFVWHDLNRNGLQDANEPGIANVSVTLDTVRSASAAPLPPNISFPQTTQTNSAGRYSFAQLPPGVYRVTFGLPTGFLPTQRAAGDPNRDSDVDASTGYAATVQLPAAPQDQFTAVDFGVYSNSLDLSITKSGPAEALVGTSFSYTLNYQLSGNTPADGVIVEDILPNDLTFLSANPAPSTRSGQRLTWDLGRRNPGASGTISIQVRAPSSIATAVRTIINSATITRSGTVPADSNPTNNSSSVSTRIVRAEVSLEKDAPGSVLVGDEFTYTLNYSSMGGIAASMVEVRDPLPNGLIFVRFANNPGGACSYRSTERLVLCQFPSLAALSSGSIGLVVRTTADSPNSVTNTATISTATAGDHPGNNRSSTTTTLLRPDLSTTLSITPTPWAVGTTATLRANYANLGSGSARNSQLTLLLPDASYTLSGLPSGCSHLTASDSISCTLGDLAAGASGSHSFSITLPANFPADTFSATAGILTMTPERTADQANNTATTQASVIRPNVWVSASGPTHIVAQGSVFWYVVEYGNRHHLAPTLTRAAEQVQLQVVLPPDVAYQGVDGRAPSSINGQTLRWDLGTLAPNASGQITIVVQTSVPAGATLDLNAQISTSTPGDNLSDNQASVRTSVVQPPDRIPASQGDLRLAIRSELDPNSQDSNPTNGIYLSEGNRIAWPTGEVLDLTAHLEELRMLGNPLPWPYAYRARVIGWSIAEVQVNGVWRSPQASDGRGRTGCRAGAVAPATQLLIGCRYAYIGGETLDSIKNPLPLREDQLLSQAHLYWTQPPAPPMRNDVYLFTVDPLAPSRLRIQVELEVWIVNAYPGAPINNPNLREVTVVPLPDPARRLIEEAFTVELLVPRSVVGPGR
jgi:uncharacterized repeat protein (TIGR01451 family)